MRVVFLSLPLVTAAGFEGWLCTSDISDKFAASVAAGLLNKKAGRPSALVELRDYDRDWLQAAKDADPQGVGQTHFEEVDHVGLLAAAVRTGAATGAVLYNITETYALPTVATLCGVHSALPVAGGPEEAAALNLTVTFDARSKWPSTVAATDYAVQELLPSTGTQAIVLQKPKDLLSGFLADLVAAKSLLAIWPEASDGPLQTLCVPTTHAHNTFVKLTTGDVAKRWDTAPFPTVMGYHGGITECVALCSPDHRPLTLVSDYAANLAFHELARGDGSVRPPPPAPAPLAYDAEKTYIAIVVSDGDNLQFDMQGTREKFDEHHKSCHSGAACPPIAWTLSNRLQEYAPSVLNWFHGAGQETDSFIMGPSGFGYTYPAQLSHSDQLQYAKLTSDAARTLQWPGYVHWDFALTWPNVRGMFDALADEEDGVASVLVASVPDFKTPAFLPEMVHGKKTSIALVPDALVWSVHGKGSFPQPTRNATDVAKALREVPKGSIKYIYVICEDVEYKYIPELVELLKGSHVELVDYRTLQSLVLQKTRHSDTLGDFTV